MIYSESAFKYLRVIQKYFIDCMVFFKVYFVFKNTESSHKIFCNVLRSSHKGPSRVPH